MKTALVFDVSQYTVDILKSLLEPCGFTVLGREFGYTKFDFKVFERHPAIDLVVSWYYGAKGRDWTALQNVIQKSGRRIPGILMKPDFSRKFIRVKVWTGLDETREFTAPHGTAITELCNLLNSVIAPRNL